MKPSKRDPNLASSEAATKGDSLCSYPYGFMALEVKETAELVKD